MLLAFFFFVTIYMLSDPERCRNHSGPYMMIKALLPPRKKIVIPVHVMAGCLQIQSWS
jgi:hypothetical protein